MKTTVKKTAVLTLVSVTLTAWLGARTVLMNLPTAMDQMPATVTTAQTTLHSMKSTSVSALETIAELDAPNTMVYVTQSAKRATDPTHVIAIPVSRMPKRTRMESAHVLLTTTVLTVPLGLETATSAVMVAPAPTHATAKNV